MKKLYRRIGLRLLRLSGIDIPSEVIENVYSPKVLEFSYFSPYAKPVEFAEQQRSKALDSLSFKALQFVQMEHKRTSEGTEVTMRIVVQKKV